MATAFPLKASTNGRYLTDKNTVPFLYHADTAWRMPQRLTPERAAAYLDDRCRRGFNAIHIHAVNTEREGAANAFGHAPFRADKGEWDMTAPIEAYWSNVDAIIRAIRDRGMLAVVSTNWFGSSAQGFHKPYTMGAALSYGGFLAERYGGFDNIMWVLGGDCAPRGREASIAAMATVLKQKAPYHLLTYHANPGHASAHYFGDEPWLDVNMAYTYDNAWPHVSGEYVRKPARPIVLGETGYEGEANTGFAWTPEQMRHQYHYTMLGGGVGHAMGTARLWCMADGWEEDLGLRSVSHICAAHSIYASLRWWDLVPDTDHRLVADGVAAMAADGNLAMVHTLGCRPVEADTSAMACNPDSAVWIDPVNGRVGAATPSSIHGTMALYRVPRANAAGDGDWLLRFGD